MKSCPMCRGMFTAKRIDQGYCSVKCSKAGDAIELRRARRLYRALYWWRYKRANAGQLLVFICREIRSWIEEDRLCQRMPPPQHDLMQDRGHQRVARGVGL